VTVRELLPPETALAFAAMQALRPHVPDAEEFTRLVDDVQRAEGYRLVAVVEDDGTVPAVAGFRVQTQLHTGRMVYVDDLSTLPEARRRGHARALLDWIDAEARRLGCATVQLDSGVGPERRDAHQLYFSHGMRIASHHFSRGVGD
jgi:GNAT superfamily N-acetyltransferase